MSLPRASWWLDEGAAGLRRSRCRRGRWAVGLDGWRVEQLPRLWCASGWWHCRCCGALSLRCTNAIHPDNFQGRRFTLCALPRARSHTRVLADIQLPCQHHQWGVSASRGRDLGPKRVPGARSDHAQRAAAASRGWCKRVWGPAGGIRG